MLSTSSAFITFLFLSTSAFLIQILIFSPISPDYLELPPLLQPSEFPSNNILKGVEKLGEGILDRPEDVCVDKEGSIYTATRDGWIKKLHRNGSWEDWVMLGGEALLGIAASMDGHLLVCDADKGLLKVGGGGRVTLLASEVEGTKIRFADDVVESSDGSIYFTDASSKFGLHQWFLDVLEAKPSGRLLKYHPLTNTTSVLLPRLGFANGVALSPHQDFLLVCESWKFRCLKHWLKGELEGRTEIFVDNLPGGPDNINLAEDGTYWIALIKLRSWELDIVHSSKMVKRIVAAFPKLVEFFTRRMGERATVVNVGADGKILSLLDDSDGKTMSFVTSAVEFEDHLYLGSLATNFIGKLPLNRSRR